MDRRLKKKVVQSADQDKYDDFWQQKAFKAVKSKNGTMEPVSSEKKSELQKSQASKASFCYTPTKKFSLTAFLESVNLSAMDIGTKTKALRDFYVQSQLGESSGLKREEGEDRFIRQLSRFLIISRSYGWDKKYKAFKVEEVRLDSLRYLTAIPL